VMGLNVPDIIMYAVLLISVFSLYMVMGFIFPDIVMYSVLFLCVFCSVYCDEVSCS
jgi:hypothetical protein